MFKDLTMRHVSIAQESVEPDTNSVVNEFCGTQKVPAPGAEILVFDITYFKIVITMETHNSVTVRRSDN